MQYELDEYAVILMKDIQISVTQAWDILVVIGKGVTNFIENFNNCVHFYLKWVILGTT